MVGNSNLSFSEIFSSVIINFNTLNSRAGFRMTLASFVDNVVLITHFEPPRGLGTLVPWLWQVWMLLIKPFFRVPSFTISEPRLYEWAVCKFYFLSRWKIWVCVMLCVCISVLAHIWITTGANKALTHKQNLRYLKLLVSFSASWKNKIFITPKKG